MSEITSAQADLIATITGKVPTTRAINTTAPGLAGGGSLAGDLTLTNTLISGYLGGQTIAGDTAANGNLTLTSTFNAAKGNIRFGSANYSFDELNSTLLMGTSTAAAGSIVRYLATKGVASGASAVWNGVDVMAATLTWSGNTNVTTATGVNLFAIAQPTMTSGSAVVVTNAASLYVAGAPLAAGSTSITNSYSVWVDAGATRLDGTLAVNDQTIFTPTMTVTSAAGAVWRGVLLANTTLTLSGGTNVSSEPGLNAAVFLQPTITSGSAITVTQAATVYIENDPAQAGSTTITNGYALRVAAGHTSFTPTATTASAAGATWKGVSVPAATLTLSGSTNVTNATGVNLIDVARPTITSGSALTVTNAATLYISNSPLAGGSTTISNAYSIWVDDGTVRFDGQLRVWEGTSGSAAGITFGTNDVGFNSSGAGVLNFTGTSGATWWTMDAAKRLISAFAGSASLPILQIFDAGTGLYRVGSGILGLTAGSSLAIALRNPTVASGTSMTIDRIDAVAQTITISGNTHVTTATGANFVNIGIATYSAASALTVDLAASLYIAGPPAGGGAGPCTITTAYALWIDAGVARFDGDGTYCMEFPADATAAGASTGRIPIRITGVGTKYLSYSNT